MLPFHPAHFFFSCPGAPRHLHSFPTRRSSDLHHGRAQRDRYRRRRDGEADGDVRGVEDPHQQRQQRSEEHTSELQSRENLVCRLLLEKKKKYDTRTNVPPRSSTLSRSAAWTNA